MLCSAHIAQAAYPIYWKGGNGSEENPVNIYSTSVWTGSAGSTTWSGENISNIPYSNHNMHFGFVAGAADTTAWLKSDGTSASTEVADSIYAHAGNFIFAAGDFKFKSLNVGFGSGEGSCVTKKGGDWALTGIMYVGSDSKGTLTIDNGSLTSSSDLSVGYNAEGTLTLNGGSLESRVIRIGHNSGITGLVEVNGGCINIKDDFYVGNNGNGTLTINGGTVEVLSSKKTFSGHNSGSKGVINLNGGVFKTQRIAQYNGSGTINFNGGTLQANAASTDFFIKKGMVVNVNDGGGVIDCGGNAIKINTRLNGSGGLLFTGGSRIDVGYNNDYQAPLTYTGATSVAPGTTLAVYQLSSANNILNNGLVISGVPTVGQTVLILTRGDGYTFETSGTAWDNGKRPICPIAPETEFELVDASNIVVKVVGDLLPGWYIGPADGNLSVAANWSNGEVPTSGNATILCSSAATLTVGETFAPSSITFAAGSAPVAINGRDLTGIVAVTNLSSVSHTINAKVYFEGDIQVKQQAMGGNQDLNKPHVTFAGGAYAAEGYALEHVGTALTFSHCAFGEYFLRNNEDSRWTVTVAGTSRNSIGDNSILHVPYAGNVGTIFISTNANLRIENQNTTYRLSYMNFGEMRIEELIVSGSEDGHLTHSQGTQIPGVFKIKSITNTKTGNNTFHFADAAIASKHVVYIGNGGINYESDATVYYIGRDSEGNYETIRPWGSDFTFQNRPGGSVGLRMLRGVEFCTDDESGIGRTITMDAVTCAQNTPTIVISGSGALKVNKTAQNTVQPPITLTDTATLEYATATATLGTGTIALGAGTTFAFKNSGRELALPSPIMLPSTGVATLRIDGAKLKSGDYTIATGVAADAADHLVIDPASTALNGRKVSLRVDEGNLVLAVKSTGTVCIVR